MFLAQAELRRRNLHPKRGITATSSRDMDSSIEPLLAKEGSLRGCRRKRHFLTRIKSIFGGCKDKNDDDKNRRDLGLDSWDGFSWAEQRQDDGHSLKRVWNRVGGEWVTVQNLGSERSVSPCDMKRGLMEEDWETEASKSRKEESIHDSFYAAATSVGSPTESDSSRSSISGLADDTNAIIRPDPLAADPIQHTLCLDVGKDNNATLTHPNIKVTEDAIKFTETSNTVVRESARPSWPNFAATKKLNSLRRTAIWNATRISGGKGFDFTKVRAGKQSNNEEEPSPESPRKRNFELARKSRQI